MIILAESTNFGSAENTSRFLYPLLHFLFGVNAAQFPVWHSVIRKTGHFIGYFTLSCSVIPLLASHIPLSRRKLDIKWAGIAFFMTAVVASLDEWHQTYLPRRTGTLHDVLLDSTAALMAQIMLFVILRSAKLQPGGRKSTSQN